MTNNTEDTDLLKAEELFRKMAAYAENEGYSVKQFAIACITGVIAVKAVLEG